MSWVGGDIPGLQATGAKMQPAPDKVGGVAQELSSTVAKLGSDASWGGEAGDEMRAKWLRDSLNVIGVGTFIGSVGEIVGELGNKLDEVESALYNAADSCQRRGARINMDSGKPLPLTVTGDPNAPAVKAAVGAQKEYQAAYDYAMNAAQSFRLETFGKLKSVVQPVLTDDPEKGGLKPDQMATVAGLLRDLYTVPLEAKNFKIAQLEQQIAGEQQKVDGSVQRLQGQLDTLTSGKDYDINQVVKAMEGKDTALADFQALEADKSAGIADLKAKKDLPFSKYLNIKLNDIPGLSKLTGKLPGALKFLNDVPVLDIAAAAAVTYFQGKEDTEKGKNSWKAYVEDGAAASIGVATGVGLGAWAFGPDGALVDAGIVTTGATLAGIAVFAVGVGDLGYQGLHEHWNEDMHDHGVVAGIATGVANTVVNTGKDLKDIAVGTGDEIENVAKKAWHGVTSLFS